MVRLLSAYLRKVQELIHDLERYRLDILGLAEVRWIGFGETTTDEEHQIWYCGEDSKRRYAVAFIVRKEVVGRIISCTLTSSPSGFQRDHTASQLFRSMHQPETTKTRWSNGSTSSSIAL